MTEAERPYSESVDTKVFERSLKTRVSSNSSYCHLVSRTLVFGHHDGFKRVLFSLKFTTIIYETCLHFTT